MKVPATLAIEKTRHDIGTSAYDKVYQMLYEKYHCYLPDCLANPEYLKKVLQELYGKYTK